MCGCYGYKKNGDGGVTSAKFLDVGKGDHSSMRIIVATALALTFLNPHVYIDTVVLLGSIGGQYQARDRYLFALGAATSSFLWFFSLSFGRALLVPVFQKNVSWKILNVLVCVTMWLIAVQLVLMKN